MLGEIYKHVCLTEEVDLIEKSRTVEQQYKPTDGLPSFYIHIIDGKFKDWIVSLEDVVCLEGTRNARFACNVCVVPKTVTDDDIEATKEELQKLMCEIFTDILTRAIDHDKMNNLSTQFGKTTQ